MKQTFTLLTTLLLAPLSALQAVDYPYTTLFRSHHTVITDSGGFNYTAIREVSPGRLLYIHDAPNMRALYVDVERVPH